MERVLYNIHSQVCGTALRRTTSKTRRLLEGVVLLVGVCGFSVLFVSHVSFVYREEANARSIPHICLSSIPNFRPDVDVTHIVLLEEIQQQKGSESYSFAVPFPLVMDESICIPQSAPKNIRFSFSKTRGFLLLPEEKLQHHNITSQLVGVSKSHAACFGEPFLQRIVFGVVGPDTVVINWLLVLGGGFIYNPRTQTIQDAMKATNHLSLWREPSWAILFDKAGVVLTSVFLFFITTTLTSFTFQETQQRMLEFTIQLQNHVRENKSLGKLIIMHVVSNLLFIPIMVGMWFFLIECYKGDKVLAFMIQSVVWMYEVYSVVSLRSQEGMEYFPRIFFLLFLVFHVYLFSCPHGFSYTALAIIVAFLWHSMLFFWNRYELPAVARGLVTPQHPRMAPSPARPQHPSTDQQGSPAPLPVLPRRVELVEPIRLEPRNILQGEHSNMSMSTVDQETQELSRPSSGLFQPDDDGDSCLYMLSGEIVVHRTSRSHSPGSINTAGDLPRRRATSASDDMIPLVVETIGSNDTDLTPRIGSTSSRSFYTDDQICAGPHFPFHT